EVLAKYRIMDTQEALGIAQKAHAACAGWKKTTFKQRSDLFKSLAKVLGENKQEYAEMITREMGKVIRESLAEVEKCAWLAETLATDGEGWLKEEQINAGGKKHVITFEPLGTVYLIMPWNYPFWQPFKVALLPMFAGNTIILKHAKNVTGSSLLIEESFIKAGFPKDVFRSVVIGHETSDALIDSMSVQAVSLTGSVASGMGVAARAGKNIKKTVLELGGSDPFIVLEGADIGKAAKAAVSGRMGNSGQVCIGAKRIIVQKSIAEEFTKEFAANVAMLRQGDPMDPETDIGPLVDDKSLADMESFVEDAMGKGARIISGGERLAGKGSFYKPTIIAHTSEGMRALKEEVFGPVVPIIIVEGADEAVGVANDTVFGLGASVWTRDLEKGEAIARRLECGGVFINHISSSHPLLPLGGIKMSGYGRELSHIGIKEFVNAKPISIYE
ncbi:MAG TPA: aldehyde dehydrogenase family protein, partial [Candidatus Micrarchaeota archaeon]|nr:aldehyde dehydrogenase family protein [Candidatus Micrarchaeota archaeon]